MISPDTILSDPNARNRRYLRDRREFNAKMFLYGAVAGRRCLARRLSDQDTQHLDRYEARLVYITVIIVIFSVLDAILTLHLLSLGATEWNPFMQQLIESDTRLFVIVKMALTGWGVVCLVALGKRRLFRLFTKEHLLHLLLIGYGGLVAYEVVLLSIL